MAALAAAPADVNEDAARDARDDDAANEDEAGEAELRAGRGLVGCDDGVRLDTEDGDGDAFVLVEVAGLTAEDAFAFDADDEREADFCAEPPLPPAPPVPLGVERGNEAIAEVARFRCADNVDDCGGVCTTAEDAARSER